MIVHAFVKVTQSHIIYPGKSLVVRLFDHVRCASIVNSLAQSIPFFPLHQNQRHFDVLNNPIFFNAT